MEHQTPISKPETADLMEYAPAMLQTLRELWCADGDDEEETAWVRGEKILQKLGFSSQNSQDRPSE